jgi:hypothetical protein
MRVSVACAKRAPGDDHRYGEREDAMTVEAAVEPSSSDAERWKAWDAFIEGRTDPGFRQLSWYTSLKVAHGWEQFGTVVRDKDTIVGGATVLVDPFAPGKCCYFIPDGPVFLEQDPPADQELVFRAVMAFIERRR